MKQNFILIKKLIKKNVIFEKSGLKCIQYETAKEIFSLMNLHVCLISREKQCWASAIYFPSYAQFLLKAGIWKNEEIENFSLYSSFTTIENTKQHSFSELNQILLENFCYKILKNYLIQERQNKKNLI